MRLHRFSLLFVMWACAAPRAAPRDIEPEKVAASGWHRALRTSRGTVHVWAPAGYEPSTAGVLLYVHGYYTDVDTAWRKHDLARQFAASARNALFIAPEAPIGEHDAVRWPKLQELLREVSDRTGTPLPAGRRVAVAHSGGFRTVRAWLDEPLDTVVLLDAVYGGEADFRQWFASAQQSGRRRRLFLVADQTASRSTRLAEALGGAHVLDAVPGRAAAEVPQDARVVLMHSQYDHMRIITAGRVIPAVLRLTRLKDVQP